jgi:hypothetical protein
MVGCLRANVNLQVGSANSKDSSYLKAWQQGQRVLVTNPLEIICGKSDLRYTFGGLGEWNKGIVAAEEISVLGTRLVSAAIAGR